MNHVSLIPSIDIIMAPMFSGKTTELVRRLVIYHELNMNVLYINSAYDTRSGEPISTHNMTLGTQNIPFDMIKVEKLEDCEIKKYDVIGIDEAGFFKNLKNIVLDWVEKQGKIVIVAGLNSDYLRRPFGELNDLIPLCDTITKLAPFCFTCRKERNIVRHAQFTKFINEKNSSKINADNILAGAQETYIPVCRQCFLK